MVRDDGHRTIDRLEAAASEIRSAAGAMGTLQRDVDRLLETVVGVDGVVPQLVRLQSEVNGLKDNCARIQQDKRERCRFEERTSAGRWKIFAQLAGSGAVGAGMMEIVRWLGGRHG